MFNNVKYECFSQYVILNNARVSALADRVEALEGLAAEYESERQQDDFEAYAEKPEGLSPNEYNAYEAGFYAASGRFSPEHLAATGRGIA
ncbi:hypothetical protein ND480_002112 [Salmonella enterica subsp. enterica serovar Bareilly]|nr:hypothetical protein [Salmonella enterica subsp. enterica serovar Bareilly]